MDEISYVLKTSIYHEDKKKHIYLVPDIERANAGNNQYLNELKSLISGKKDIDEKYFMDELLMNNFKMYKDLQVYIENAFSFHNELKALYSPDKFSFYEYSPESWAIANKYDLNMVTYISPYTLKASKYLNFIDLTLIEANENRFHFYNLNSFVKGKNLAKIIYKSILNFKGNHKKDHKYMCKYDNH